MTDSLTVRQPPEEGVLSEAIFHKPAAYPNSSSRRAAAEPLFKLGLLGFLTAIPASSASSLPPIPGILRIAKSASSKRVDTPNLSKILLR